MADVLESLLKRVSHQLGSTFGRLVKEGEGLRMRNPFSRNQIGLPSMELSQGNNGSMSKIPAIINKQTNKDLPTTQLL